MIYINVTHWIAAVCYVIVIIAYIVLIRKGKKEHPNDRIYKHLMNMYLMLATIITLLGMDRLYIYLCLQ